MQIEGVVARDSETRKLIDITKHQVLLQMLRQVQRGSKIELIARTLAIRNVGRRIQAIWILANVHSQKTVRAAQPPSRQDFPLGERFDAVRSAAHLVAGDEGKNDVAGDGATLQNRCTGFRRSQVRVIVVKSGNV